MKKLLIADDNEDFLKVLKLALIDKGYDVKIVSQKKDIIPAIKSFKPDIVLLDVFLDQFDGRQISKEISTSKLRRIPIIIFSANPYSLSHFESYGAVDYIEKPINIEKLVSKIETIFQKRESIS
ncbi:MAG: hypothetical protein NVSMB45_17190 [Ginsengibacter sp.]